MKHEYHEGPKAGENFEQLARAVFQAPKVAVPKKQPKKKDREDATASGRPAHAIWLRALGRFGIAHGLTTESVR